MSEKPTKKITYHILSLKPGNNISEGSNYETEDIADAISDWKKDDKNQDREILAIYSTAVIDMPLLRASEIEAVEFPIQHSVE